MARQALADCSCKYQGSRLASEIYETYPTSSPGKYKDYGTIDLYGTMCAAWDQMPMTPGFYLCDGKGPPWDAEFNYCQVPWCYVDSSCESAVATTVFEGSEIAFYSYEACGGVNCYPFSAENGCPYDPHGDNTYKVHKSGGCECLYQGELLPPSIWKNHPDSNPGQYQDLSAITAFGTTCSAWDMSPLTPWYVWCPPGSDFCDTAYNWCVEPWCYVAEGCSTSLPSATFAGSPLAHFSYDTCGAPDCYTGAYPDFAPDGWTKFPSTCPFDNTDNSWYAPVTCPQGYTIDSSVAAKQASYIGAASVSAAAMAAVLTGSVAVQAS